MTFQFVSKLQKIDWEKSPLMNLFPTYSDIFDTILVIIKGTVSVISGDTPKKAIANA